MKRFSLHLILLLGLTLALEGQSTSKLFSCLQADISMGIRNNEEKAFAVNVLPLVAQYHACDEIVFRITSIRIQPENSGWG